MDDGWGGSEGHSIRPERPMTERPSAARGIIWSGMLDERDLRIIGALQADARATFADVGRSAGLAPSSVHQRVRKLERAGVIRGYRAQVDPRSLGLFVTALVSVTPLDPRQPDDV